MVGNAGDIQDSTGSTAAAPYNVGIVVTYTCANGWQLVGPITSTCEAGFTWSEAANLPTCRQGMYNFV